MDSFTTVTRKTRTPRKAQGATRNWGLSSLASGGVNPSGTNEGEGQGSARKAADRGKGHSVEQPLIVSDEEDNKDEEGSEDMAVSGKGGSEDYVPLDTEDSEDVATPRKAGISASVQEMPPPNEDDDQAKIGKLSLAFKQEKTIFFRWRDGTYHPAKVLEIKEQPAGCFKYYVHYTQFDRRNDAWVNLKQLNPNFSGSFLENTGDIQARTGVMTRRQKKKLGIVEDHDELDAESLREHEALTKVKKINKIRLGKYELETWYYSPLPAEYDDCEELFFCEFCLTFLKRESQFKRHMRKNCNWLFPPGRKIYSSRNLSVSEVDGTKFRIYGENLCYLAKMFLDHKLLLSDVGAFLFYILCEEDASGFHIVAYFSKEKVSETGNILACILTLPPYQRKGYGNFLIAFAYELAKREGKIGKPEHPLSDLGQLSFGNYWTEVILEILSKNRNISIEDISKMSVIHPDDVLKTLRELDLVLYRNGEYILNAKPQQIISLMDSTKKSVLKLEPQKLEWP